MEMNPKNTKSFLIGCIYRPTDSSLYLPPNWFELFSNMLLSVNDLEMEMMLLGDVHINYLKKTKHCEIKDMIELQGFMQLIECFTRITAKSNTIIDVILSNKNSNIPSSSVIPLNLSDYDCIVCVRKINHRKNTTTRNHLPKLQTLPSYCF